MRQYETTPCSTVSWVKFHRFGMHSWLIAIIPLYAPCLWYVPTIVIESCIVILLISCAMPAVPGFRWIQQSQPAVSIWSIWDPSSRGQGLEAFSAPDVFAEVDHTDHTVHICTNLYTVTDVTGCCQRSIHLHKASLSWTLKDMLPHTKFSAVKYLGVDQPVILRLSPIARLLFNPLDDPVLEYQALTSLKLILPLSHIVSGTSR